MTMTDKILTRIMIGSLIGMLIVTVLGVIATGLDHMNEPVSQWVNVPMCVLGSVLFGAMFWMLAIWSGLTQKPVSGSKTNDKQV